MIIRKEKNKLINSSKLKTQEYKQIDYEGNSYHGKNKVDIKVVLTANTEEEAKKEDIQNQLERIKNLEKQVVALTLSSTYQQLERERVTPITPPLKKNNVILKNVNFQYAAKLWDFIINEMDSQKAGDNEVKKKEYKERGKAKQFIDETFLLDYLVLQAVENPDFKSKHDKKIIEQLIANIVEKIIDVNETISEEQLKNIVSKQYTIIKYKRQVTNKQIQEIFKKNISKYLAKINSYEGK